MRDRKSIVVAKTDNSTSKPNKRKTTASKKSPKKRSASRRIDGVTPAIVQKKSATSKQADLKKTVPETSPSPHRSIDGVMKGPHTVTTIGHVQEHSQTLMRHVVPKPTVQKHPKASATLQPGMSAHPVPTKATITPKRSIGAVDITRVRHAAHVKKSSSIVRFVNTPNTFVATPVAPQVSVQPSVSASTVIPSSTTATLNPGSQLFMKSLQSATSHQQRFAPPPHHDKRYRLSTPKRIAAISGIVMSLVFLVGLLVYQNMGNIRLQLASTKAGFTASLPARQPSGYSLANFSAASGVVAANFISNSDNSAHFQIVEKPTTWNSNDLLNNYVKTVTSNYDVLNAGSRTIYMYGNGTATWVNNDIWYLVSGSGMLSTDQLIQIAGSM